jgi:prolyl oligopeptidase
MNRHAAIFERVANADLAASHDSVYRNSAETCLDPTSRLLAYAQTEPGTAAQTWRIRDQVTHTDLPDILTHVAPESVRWLPDSTGLIYSRVLETTYAALYGCDLRYHHLGTAQQADRVLYAGPTPGWSVRSALSDDGAYLVFIAWPDTELQCTVLILPTADLTATPQPLFAEMDGDYHLVGGDAGRLWFLRSAADTPCGALLGVAPTSPAQAMKTIFPPADVVLQQAVVVAGHVVAAALHNAAPVLLIYTAAGQLRAEIPSPSGGAITALGQDDSGALLVVAAAPARPPTLYRADMLHPERCMPLDPPPDWPPEDFVSERHWCTSRDGTPIPIWLSYRRDLTPNGAHPTILEVYGGFGEPATPDFSLECLRWMQAGGIWARPCVRGGGDFGRRWHLAAAGGRQQRTIDDTLAAAEWLINSGWTAQAHLGITGRSHGGLIAAACLVRRPGLFGAALLESALLDLVHFDQLGAGAIWRSEYGDPRDPAVMQRLQKIAPLSGIRPGTAYPATLIISAERDDWVDPCHSAHFFCRVTTCPSRPSPYLPLDLPGCCPRGWCCA